MSVYYKYYQLFENYLTSLCSFVVGGVAAAATVVIQTSMFMVNMKTLEWYVMQTKHISFKGADFSPQHVRDYYHHKQ